MDPVVSRIEAAYPKLPPGERAVARIVLDDYPFAALDSLRTLAERAGVSPPTASRLVDRLGFGSFTEFQDIVRAGAQDRSRLREFAAQSLDPGSAARELQDGLSGALAAVNPPLLDSAADTLATARSVWALGGPLSELAADYLVRQLGALRPGARLVPGPAHERARSLLDVTSQDLVVAYDFRRYSDRTAAFVLRIGTHAAEIANRTVHGVMHVGWVPDPAGGYRGQMGVYVKPNGRLGAAYMTAIRPFRHLIVYPPMLRQIGMQWRAGAEEEPAGGA